MIFPTFLDEHGEALPEMAIVPKECDAEMFILSDESRKSVHQARIKPGLEFQICEGCRVRGTGVVLEIIDLFDP